MQPPPPRLSAPAFAAASAAARRLPPSHRHPTVHLAVVLGSVPVPLLRHAHALLILLSHRGFHVFLQTEVDIPSPPSIAPVTHKVIPNLITTSPADFFLVVADQNLSPASAQVCFPSARELVQIHVADLPDTLFTAWTRQLRAHSDHTSHPTLAANPNIVTSAHIEALLHTLSPSKDYRRSYASLLRTAALTNGWLPVAPHTFPNPSFQQSANQQRPNLPEISQTQASQHDQPLSLRLHSQSSEQSQFDQLASAPLSAQLHVQPPSPALTNKALRRGMRAVMRLYAQSSVNPAKNVCKSQLSFCWLRHSSNTSARLLRAQILAAALHKNLVSTLGNISDAPKTTISNLHLSQSSGAQTNLHRQRLIREVNELLPRVEELGTRLLKRPSRKRRRTKILQSNPWNGYLKEATASAIEGNGGPPGIATCTATDAKSSDDMSRCFVCRSYTARQASECTVCLAEKCVPVAEAQLIGGNLSAMRKAFQQVMTSRPGALTPWVFTSGVFPVQPLINGSIPNGAIPPDHSRRSSKLRSPLDDKTRSFVASKSRTVFSGMRGGIGVPSRQTNDIAASMESLSFDERNSSLGDNSSTGRGQSDQNLLRRQNPPLWTKTPTNLQARSTPHRLAVSAPNGPSVLEFEFSRRPPNGGGRHDFGSHYGLSPHTFRSVSSRDKNVDDVRSGSKSAASLQVKAQSNVESFPSNARLPTNHSNPAFLGDLFSNSNHYDAVELEHDSLIPLKSEEDGHFDSSTGSHRVGQEELYMRSYESYEAEDKGKRYLNAAHRVVSQPIAVPGIRSNNDANLNGINSLEALAAASDAANGGTGSATRESLRAVSAVVTPGRTHSSESPSPPMNGTYNMF